jgi:hypothetical protein
MFLDEELTEEEVQIPWDWYDEASRPLVVWAWLFEDPNRDLLPS